MKAPYGIVEIARQQILGPEHMGSKAKFWCQLESSERGRQARWLFKHPQEHTGQHWAERIAAELAARLGIPHAPVRLATYEGARGSICKSFVRPDAPLFHGNELLSFFAAGYDRKKKYGQSDHNLKNIFLLFDRLFSDPAARKRVRRQFAGYLVLDALIGNTDRHHENWCATADLSSGSWELAPSFDHASSLGRELRDARRSRWLAEGWVGRYARKGRSGIFWSSRDRRPPSPLNLVRLAAARHPTSFRRALRSVRQLPDASVREVINRVPVAWMSQPAREFTTELVLYTQQQLAEVRT